MKILIVEDNVQIRRLIVKIVGSSSNTIFECEEHGQALLKYRIHLPDWVVMDVKMREVDGIEAAGQILAAFPDAKIVIVTDYHDKNLCRMAHEAGARAYIIKENLINLRGLLVP